MRVRAGLLLAGVAVGGMLLLGARAASGAPGPGSLESLPRTVQQPFPDQGPGTEVGRVREVVERALTAEVAAFAVPSGGARATASVRVAAVAPYEAPDLAARAGYDSPLLPIEPFRSATFRPVRWDGIAVGDTRAKVYVIGHSVLVLPDGSVRRNRAWQVQLLLQREPDAVLGWRVIAESVAGGEQVASVDAAG